MLDKNSCRKARKARKPAAKTKKAVQASKRHMVMAGGLNIASRLPNEAFDFLRETFSTREE